MSTRPRDYPRTNYDAHARSVARDAYWNQVRRTVNGEPPDDAQIAMIVDAITAGLSLTPDDVVLDLACGNGALSSYLFDKCAGLLGVDVSPYLIEVAQSDFACLPNYRFAEADAAAYLSGATEASCFTKALIYGSFQYLPRTTAVSALKSLHQRFPGVSKVFIGNIPDKRNTARFFGAKTPSEDELNDPEAQIGVWYLPDEIAALAEATGWRATLTAMPAGFYAAAYRFDATLERLER